RERAEASVEMVEPAADQLQREYFPIQNLSHFLMRHHVGANVVAGKPQLAAAQQVTFALEVILLRQLNDLETASAKPLLEMRRFAPPDFVAEFGRDKVILQNQSCVGRKDHVRKPWYGIDQVNLRRQFLGQHAL